MRSVACATHESTGFDDAVCNTMNLGALNWPQQLNFVGLPLPILYTVLSQQKVIISVATWTAQGTP